MAWALKRGEKGLFIPDEHLGRNTGYRMGIPLDEMARVGPAPGNGRLSEEEIRRARVILWKGHCSVHQRFLPAHVERARNDYPGIQRHRPSGVPLGRLRAGGLRGIDGVYYQAGQEGGAGSQWAIGTEIHLVKRLAQENPDRTVISLDDCGCLCSTMYRISPQHLCWVLESLVEGQVVNRVQVDDETRRWAHRGTRPNVGNCVRPARTGIVMELPTGAEMRKQGENSNGPAVNRIWNAGRRNTVL